ncbi:DUF6273 domain-containing protein, partial [Ruminococcaceae bacterium OttesenSCG-928-I18]|nr:DUF6273 domain-containing protein [Ruminococcaceae bacterium OttesenSCG-928-I18]
MVKTKHRIASILVVLLLVMGLPLSANAANIQGGQPTIAVNSTEIVFAGHTWVVVADRGSAFGINTGTTDSNSVTLLLKNGDGGFSGYSSAYFNSSTGTNIYPNYELYQAMQGIYSVIGTTSAMEQRLIDGRLLDEVAVSNPGTYEEMTTQEYVWPLSESEYGAIGSAQAYITSWWLRSPYLGQQNNAYLVDNLGSDAHPVDITKYEVRPALNLNLSSVIFTSDSTGGKPSTPNAGLEQTQAPSSPLKLTVWDE